MVLKRQATWQTLGTDCMDIVQIAWDGSLWVSRVILGRWSWHGHSVVALGKKLCTLIIQISQDRELFGSIEFSVGDGLEMAGHSVVTPGKNLHDQYWSLSRLSWWGYTWEMVLKWQTAEQTLHKETGHCWGLPRLSCMSQFRDTWEMVLKCDSIQWWHWGRERESPVTVEVSQDRAQCYSIQ